jgi:hypothetical protein
LEGRGISPGSYFVRTAPLSAGVPATPHRLRRNARCRFAVRRIKGKGFGFQTPAATRRFAGGAARATAKTLALAWRSLSAPRERSYTVLGRSMAFALRHPVDPPQFRIDQLCTRLPPPPNTVRAGDSPAPHSPRPAMICRESRLWQRLPCGARRRLGIRFPAALPRETLA